MIELFASAFVLGALFNATPGPILAESLRRGMRGGFKPALLVQIGSLVGDFAWAVLGLLGTATLLALTSVETPLAIGGAAFLSWMAVQAMRDALSPMPIFDLRSLNGMGRSSLATGAILSLSNPQNVTYWTALGGTVTALGVANPGWSAFTIFLAGFMASSVLWCFICAGVIAWTRRFVGPRTWMVLNLGCAIGLGIFAFLVIVRTLG